MGERGVSSVKANCSPIEWNDSEELREVFFFFPQPAEKICDIELKSPGFIQPSVCFSSCSAPV